jgi:hypothetical protein
MPKPCKTCGGRRKTSSAEATSSPGVLRVAGATGEQEVMSDSNYELVLYTSANRGKHGVRGASTGVSYGYRGGGSKFLVHKSDIEAQPNLFVPVERTVELVSEPEPEPAKPAEPEQTVTVGLPSVPEFVSKNFAGARVLDLGEIPGVTPAVEAKMVEAGLNTPKSILEAGITGLVNVDLVGPTRANLIYEFVLSRFGDAE